MNSAIIQTLRNELLAPEVLSFEYLLDFCYHYKRELENGKVLTSKKTKFSEETIKTYTMTISNLEAFENDLGIKFKLSEISSRFFKGFETYLIQKNYTLNTISLFLSKLKAICSVAMDRDMAFINTKSVKTPRDKTTKIYLTLEEIKQLRNEPKTKMEKRYIDAFIIGCFTGLRFRQLNLFVQNPLNYIKEYDGFTYIDMTSDKTNEQSIIPLGDTVANILSKYENGRIAKLYLSDYNSIVKKVGERAGITNNIVVRKVIGNNMTEVLKPKFEEITSHTARRTFVTLLKPLLHDEVLMGITGHKSIDTLNQYNRSAILDKVSPALGHEFFNQTI